MHVDWDRCGVHATTTLVLSWGFSLTIYIHTTSTTSRLGERCLVYWIFDTIGLRDARAVLSPNASKAGLMTGTVICFACACPGDVRLHDRLHLRANRRAVRHMPALPGFPRRSSSSIQISQVETMHDRASGARLVLFTSNSQISPSLTVCLPACPFICLSVLCASLSLLLHSIRYR